MAIFIAYEDEEKVKVLGYLR